MVGAVVIELGAHVVVVGSYWLGYMLTGWLGLVELGHQIILETEQ